MIVTSSTALILLYSRSVGVFYFAAGATACAFSSKLVKRLIRQPRPKHPSAKQKSYGCVLFSPFSDLTILCIHTLISGLIGSILSRIGLVTVCLAPILLQSLTMQSTYLWLVYIFRYTHRFQTVN